MKYHLLHLGCQMNQSDGERIRTVLEEMGYQRVEEEQQADVLGIVACSVRQKAIDKVYTKIHKWNEWKRSRSLLTFASGCILPADRHKLLTRFDLLFTIQELPKLPDMIRQYGVVTPSTAVPAATISTTNGSEATDYWHVRPRYSSAFDAFVPIQNGCDKFCTFCAVPYTRGREVSRPSREILTEVESLMARGYKSITLLGQNVNSYGLDQPDREPEICAAAGAHRPHGRRRRTALLGLLYLAASARHGRRGHRRRGALPLPGQTDPSTDPIGRRQGTHSYESQLPHRPISRGSAQDS